jgi:spore maturation protein CgeB
MSENSLSIVIVGLSVTSSWGNGHATTYRSLIRELVRRGHDVTFLERDVPWYAENRDLQALFGCRIELYQNLHQLKTRLRLDVMMADMVIVGSYVPEGAHVGEWVLSAATGVVAFYDIDTPVTLAKLERDECEYLTPELIAQYQLYLSFTGGPTLERLEREYASPRARALYCSVDPALYYPETEKDTRERNVRWDLGYMGTYSEDRQRHVQRLLLDPARRWRGGQFALAGPQYPRSIRWPANVKRIEHLPPSWHRSFYNRQRFTLNITRADMIRAGYSPSVRLFEAAACGTPIISDSWEGLDTIFVPGSEILIARNTEDTLRLLRETSEEERLAIAQRARRRVLSAHTAAHRALELETYALELLDRQVTQ